MNCFNVFREKILNCSNHGITMYMYIIDVILIFTCTFFHHLLLGTPVFLYFQLIIDCNKFFMQFEFGIHIANKITFKIFHLGNFLLCTFKRVLLFLSSLFASYIEICIIESLNLLFLFQEFSFCLYKELKKIYVD